MTKENKYIDLLALQGVTEITLPSTSGSKWSWTFPLQKNVSFGLEIKVEGSNTANVGVDIEHSNEDLTDAEQNLTNDDYVVPDNEPEIATLDDQKVFIIPFGPTPAINARVKFNMGAGNDATTTITRLRLVSSRNL